MKIIHVEDYFDPTAGYQINELLNASKEFKDEVILITSNDMTPFHKHVNLSEDEDFEKTTGVKIIRLEVRFKFSSRLLLKNLKKKIDDLNPDVVFYHGIGDFKDLILWGKKTKYKVIRDCHMSWVASKNKFRYIYYFLYKLFFSNIINRTNKYEKIYALGDEEYEYLKKIGIKEDKIDFLRHGYNKNNMYFDSLGRKNIREYYKIADEDILISYIGKLDYAKRPDLVLDIVNLLNEKIVTENNIQLLFIGPKNREYMKYFNDKKLKINNKIDIYLDDAKPFNQLRNYYSASDICIFPKETSLSAIHAQVCGCIVIMENHLSNYERVVLKNNLYKENDLNEASKILKRIILDREYRNRSSSSSSNELLKREYENQIKKLHSDFI